MNTAMQTPSPEEMRVTPEMLLSRIDAITADSENIRNAIDQLRYVDIKDFRHKLAQKAELESNRMNTIVQIVEARERTNRELITTINRLIDKL